MEIDPDDPVNPVKKTYMYADSQIIAQRNGGQAAAKYFYVTDRLGAVRQVIDNTGAVVANYTYSPFGQMLEEGGSFNNSFLFTGQWFDTEFSQYCLRARQYDPVLMRFGARDPVFGKPQEPMTLHPYLYCLNDPANRIDPDGRWAKAVVAPVAAGYATHALAIAVVTYGVSMMNDNAMTLGIAIERSIGDVMTLVGEGLNALDAVARSVPKYLPKQYPWGSKENIEYQIYKFDQGMKGDPQFRNQKDPKDWWKRVYLEILEFFDSIKD